MSLKISYLVTKMSTNWLSIPICGNVLGSDLGNHNLWQMIDIQRTCLVRFTYIAQFG